MASKRKIIDELLKDAPPGQVKQVLKDVKTLVGDDKLVDEVASATIKKYDLDNLTQVNYDVDGKACEFLLSRYGDKEDAGVYFDPATNKCIEYDHLEQKCKVAGDKTGEELKDLQGDEESEKLRSEIYSHLCQTYMKNSYPYGTCAVYSTSSSGNGIAICISSTVYKPRSYWSGRWTSEWVLTDKSSLKGKCAVATHYYENGNVQFRSNREFVVKDLGVKDKSEEASAIAQAVKRCISEEEFGYQEDLEESLRDFSETTFKKLRRQLPLTQLTFPWTTGASSLATELMSREK